MDECATHLMLYVLLPRLFVCLFVCLFGITIAPYVVLITSKSLCFYSMCSSGVYHKAIISSSDLHVMLNLISLLFARSESSMPYKQTEAQAIFESYSQECLLIKLQLVASCARLSGKER